MNFVFKASQMLGNEAVLSTVLAGMAAPMLPLGHLKFSHVLGLFPSLILQYLPQCIIMTHLPSFTPVNQGNFLSLVFSGPS